MNGAISQIFSILFSGAILFSLIIFVARLAFRKRFKGFIPVFAWLFSLGAIGFVLINTGFLPGEFGKLAKIQNSLILLSWFSYLAIMVFGILNNPDAKKKKTLARLPLIGALLGWGLNPLYTALAAALIEITLMFLLAQKKDTHNYLWRAQLKAFLGAPLLAMYGLPAGEIFLGYLLWSVIFKLTAVNAAIVKDLALDYDKKP